VVDDERDLALDGQEAEGAAVERVPVKRGGPSSSSLL